MKRAKTKENPNEARGDIDERDASAAGEACPVCGMERKEWKGAGGRGYELSGDSYCCQGCAQGETCTCGEDYVEEKPMD